MNFLHANQKKGQGGFSLLELVIGLTLLVLITAMMFSAFGPWMKFKKNLETEARLKDLQQATLAFYRANSYNIDSSDPLASVDGLTYGALQLDPPATATPAKMGPVCPAVIDDFQPVIDQIQHIQPYAVSSVGVLAKDGWNGRICVFVSPRLYKTMGGIVLSYHTVAFVSPGENGLVSAGTTFAPMNAGVANSPWTLTVDQDSDDRGAMVDGFGIAFDNYKATQTRLNRIVSAYETFFNVGYLANEWRDVSLDYFYSNISDATVPRAEPYVAGSLVRNPLRPTVKLPFSYSPGVLAIPTEYPGFGSLLGLGDDDVRDAWGQPLYIDNSSPLVRSSLNPNAAMSYPPYTAMLGALLPGPGLDATGNVDLSLPNWLTSTVVGNY